MAFYIGSSGIHGSGLFTNETIEAGQEIGVIFFRIRNTGVFASDFMEYLNGRFTNHSDNSNAVMILRENEIILRAIRTINSNEEITSNYHELIALFPKDESVMRLIKFW